jgi:6-phosphogluconolactonase
MHPRALARRVGLVALGIALVGVSAAATPASADDGSGDSGHVYAISNATSGNQLLVWDRGAGGQLGAPFTVDTGGLGTGGGLGSQGAVVASDDGRWVVAVNPGSDQVSLFSVDRKGVRLVDTESSGGDRPVSATINDDTIYVLNAGAGNDIAGLRIDHGQLVAIPGSTRPLSADGAGGAQVGFSADGDRLVVTEKATNRISTYPVRHGVAGAGTSIPSTGVTPFGFAFDRKGQLLVSNANGGAAAGSSLSSYAFRPGGLVPLDGPEPTNQTAACWVAVSKNGRYAYTTNTGSASISGYAVARAGSVSLLSPDGVSGSTGAGPTDFDFSGDGRYLYTLDSVDDTITIHRLGGDGSLRPVGTVAGLPATAVGLAAN